MINNELREQLLAIRKRVNDALTIVDRLLINQPSLELPPVGDGYERIDFATATGCDDAEFQVFFGGKWDGNWDPVSECWWGTTATYAFRRPIARTETQFEFMNCL